MKLNNRLKSVLILILTLTLIITTTNCGDDDPPENNKDGTLVIGISHSGGNLTRTIQPDTDMTIASYSIIGVGPGDALFTMNGVTTDIVTINNLVPGTWAICVFAKNAEGITIASGTTTCTIYAGLTAAAGVTVTPLEGTGVLLVSVSWEAALTNPVLEASLTPPDGSPANITFTVSSNSASYSDSELNAGYYILTLSLKDGTTKIWGAAEAVRILTGQVTIAVFNVKNNTGVVITIGEDLQNPIDITLSGQVDILSPGTDMTVTAIPSEPVDSYRWYLNGTVLSGETGSSITIGSNLSPGSYRLDVIVSKGAVLSSKSHNFIVSSSSGNTNTIVNIRDDLQNPIDIVLSGQADNLNPGTDMTVTATPAEPVDSYQWYLNSILLPGETGSSITIGSALVVGNYRLDVVVSKGNLLSSKGHDFSVSGADSLTYSTYKLTASDGIAYDQFGYSVSVSGDGNTV
ncbi:MAG: hypothetical protein KAI25_07950, partial [Hyphomicrobiaceae bacterium]|nr:hypothetical protein [Hyphomicrobiaceae bacterium]